MDTGLRPSIQIPGDSSSDAQHGNGQYFTDLTAQEAQNYRRSQVSQALFRTPRKWGLTGKLQNIAWLQVLLTTGAVHHVQPLFPSQVHIDLPMRGIWLRPGTHNLPPHHIIDNGLVLFQPMPSGNR